MSESEIRRLLEYTKDSRQLRLFAVACCRNIWHLLTDQISRNAVEIAESFADGLVSEGELAVARAAAWDAVSDAETAAASVIWDAAWAASDAAWAAGLAVWDAGSDAAWAAWDAANYAGSAALWAAARDDATALASNVSDIGWDTEKEQQLVFLQDIINQPSIELNLNLLYWNNSLLSKFATNIYTNKDFSLMPILADALEDANAPATFIQHCREEVHIKGCWLLDVLTGKR